MIGFAVKWVVCCEGSLGQLWKKLAQSHPSSFVHEGGLEPYFPTPHLHQTDCLKSCKYGKKSLKSFSVPNNDFFEIYFYTVAYVAIRALFFPESEVAETYTCNIHAHMPAAFSNALEKSVDAIQKQWSN